MGEKINLDKPVQIYGNADDKVRLPSGEWIGEGTVLLESGIRWEVEGLHMNEHGTIVFTLIENIFGGPRTQRETMLTFEEIIHGSWKVIGNRMDEEPTPNETRPNGDSYMPVDFEMEVMGHRLRQFSQFKLGKMLWTAMDFFRRKEDGVIYVSACTEGAQRVEDFTTVDLTEAIQQGRFIPLGEA